MITKSIRLTEEEAAELRDYLAATGEVEAAVLKRAALRGLAELRLERAILAYLQGAGSQEAATIAGLPRAEFLHLLMERGVTVLRGPSTVAEEAAYLADALRIPRLKAALDRLAAGGQDRDPG